MPRWRRFLERDPEPGVQDLALLAGARAVVIPDEAAVLSLIDASGVPGLGDPVPARPSLLQLTGPVRWVCEVVIGYIGTTRAAEWAVRRVTASESSVIPPPLV